MPRKISRRVGKIWERLGQWYGSRLADNYGPTPPDDWANLIDRTDDERLEDALFVVRRASPIHPPTLGQLEAAIPKRDSGQGGPSKATILAELMLKTHGAEMCIHQRARPWSFFGPMHDFEAPRKHPNAPQEYITHPDARGVQVSECEPCGKPSFRALLEHAITEGVAA